MTAAADPVTAAEVAEANARRLMAELAGAGTPRGWDGMRARAETLVEIDEALDAWLAC